MSLASAACTSGLCAWPPPMFVTKNPGAIALAVMPYAASSSASDVHEVPGAGLRRHVGRADRGLDLGRGQRRRHDDPPEPARAHVAGRGARGGEDPVEVDVDHPVPALVGVTLERALVHPRPLAAGPGADEADAGVDAGVGEGHVEPAVQRRRFVDRAIERGMVGHVRGRGPDVEPVARQARRSAATAVAVDVDQRDAGAVRRKHLPVCEPDAAGTAGDDHAESGHIESRGNVHAHSSWDLVWAAERIARRRGGRRGA